MLKIAFFDSKEYDRQSFEAANKDGEFDIRFFETRLTPDTYKLAEGCDVVCVFVNDEKVPAVNVTYTAEDLKTGLKLRKGKKVFHKAVAK